VRVREFAVPGVIILRVWAFQFRSRFSTAYSIKLQNSRKEKTAEGFQLFLEHAFLQL